MIMQSRISIREPPPVLIRTDVIVRVARAVQRGATQDALPAWITVERRLPNLIDDHPVVIAARNSNGELAKSFDAPGIPLFHHIRRNRPTAMRHGQHTLRDQDARKHDIE